MEHAAEAGEILVSAETAALLPGDCLGRAKAPGVLLVREPPGHEERGPYIPRPQMPPEPDAALPVARDPRARGRRRRRLRASSRHDRLHPLRRDGRADRAKRPGGGRRGVAPAGECRRSRDRGTGVYVPGLRRRPRRRQAHPHRGRAEGHRRQRGTHAPRVAQDRRKQVFAADPHRRSSRLRLRRRHRPALPPHVYGHGRRGEPAPRA